MTSCDKYEARPSICFLTSLRMPIRVWNESFFGGGVWKEFEPICVWGERVISLTRVSLLSCSVCPIMRPSVDSVCVRCGLVLVLALVLVCPTAEYNLDEEHSLEFTGPPSSMFGYSVLLHHHGAQKWSGSILFCSSDFDLWLTLYWIVWSSSDCCFSCFAIPLIIYH